MERKKRTKQLKKNVKISIKVTLRAIQTPHNKVVERDFFVSIELNIELDNLWKNVFSNRTSLLCRVKEGER